MIRFLKRNVNLKARALFKQLVPPFLFSLIKIIAKKTKKDRDLPSSYHTLPRANEALYQLITHFDFDTVLDVGSGAGEHATLLAESGKKVTAIDFGTSYYALQKNEVPGTVENIIGDFYSLNSNITFDVVWASHVLEHQPNPGQFIKKCIELTKPNGLICITVPPLKHNIVGGHLTLWNAGLLVYNLVFNGLDCSTASILTSGSNITVIAKNTNRKAVALDWDKGDINKLKQYFPSFVEEPFDGRISRWNWK